MDICQLSDSCSDEWSECTDGTSKVIVSIDENHENIDDKINKHDKIIEDIKKRLVLLKETMSLLNQQLKEEMMLLKRHQDEYNYQLHQIKLLQDFESAKSAAKAASDAYIAEINYYSSAGTSINQSKMSLKNDYQIKLEQVKRLVDNEITNIRNCGDSLEPLNQMMTRWSLIGIKQKSNFHENMSNRFFEITGN